MNQKLGYMGAGIGRRYLPRLLVKSVTRPSLHIASSSVAFSPASTLCSCLLVS